ncbi:MAG TPA: arginine--tRNA ligase [Dissulfurispiraceae bacterium]|nr:arginine--tRNA ligase [Dissulfurispiraceae bacterium]
MERTLREILINACATLIGPSGARDGLAHIEIETPKEESFGDLSTPVAMVLAKTLKRPPRKIAEDIVGMIQGNRIFSRIEIAGPGFINFSFTRDFVTHQLQRLIAGKADFLTEDIGGGRRVQVEFVSANPTGPLHLGHGRGAALGAALSNLLETAGYQVTREFYINDAGRQVRLLGLSVFAKYHELAGVEYRFPEDGYRGDYVEDLARELTGSYGSELVERPFEEVATFVIDFSYKNMLQGILRDLDDFGVHFDVWQSEKELYEAGDVEQALEDLRDGDYVYVKEGATWFRSTSFGDDKDRVVIKQDGEYTYFAPDIAYHRRKVEHGYDEIIDIWGADHHGYIPRMQAVIQALGYPKEALRVLLVQMVSLLRGGKPVQMSKRAGEFVTLREVMEEIGADTTKFLFLTRRSDSHLEIDIDIAKAQSQENPVFYVQYAHARINSIFQRAREAPGGDQADETSRAADLDGNLFNDEELRIAKKLLQYPMVFRNAALAREPHRITFYLQEVAGLFHPYYQKHRVITEDRNLTGMRLGLCEAIAVVLRHGLRILGVQAPEKM